MRIMFDLVSRYIEGDRMGRCVQSNEADVIR
jgi:hypothetical protein